MATIRGLKIETWGTRRRRNKHDNESPGLSSANAGFVGTNIPLSCNQHQERYNSSESVQNRRSQLIIVGGAGL
jgi:hypothetical protein